MAARGRVLRGRPLRRNPIVSLRVRYFNFGRKALPSGYAETAPSLGLRVSGRRRRGAGSSRSSCRCWRANR
jgi:hypothetical protein